MTLFKTFLNYPNGQPITAKAYAYNAKGWSSAASSTGSVVA